MLLEGFGEKPNAKYFVPDVERSEDHDPTRGPDYFGHRVRLNRRCWLTWIDYCAHDWAMKVSQDSSLAADWLALDGTGSLHKLSKNDTAALNPWTSAKTANLKAVALTCAIHAHSDTGTRVFPSVESICKRNGWGTRSNTTKANTYLHLLTYFGWLEHVAAAHTASAHTQNKANEYRLTFPAKLVEYVDVDGLNGDMRRDLKFIAEHLQETDAGSKA